MTQKGDMLKRQKLKKTQQETPTKQRSQDCSWEAGINNSDKSLKMNPATGQ